MDQQFRPKGFGPAALGARLKLVQDLGVRKIFSNEAVKLQGAEGFEIAVKAQPHHFGVKAAGARQQCFKGLTVGVVLVEQACNGRVQHPHDVRNGN